ncbi:MAG: Coenzyme F420 hydrogenase/dehydrogenase, beta subunit C-terminal domain [Promethearchaeota archaeon]
MTLVESAGDAPPKYDGRMLHQDVVAKGSCTGCAACAAVCQALGDKTIVFQPEAGNLPVITKEDDCLECGLCYSVCPRTDFPPGSKMGWKEGDEGYVGEYLRFELLRATDPEVREKAQDGGVVTALLKALMEVHYLNGAVVSTVKEDWLPHPALIRDPGELAKSMGTRYSISPNLLVTGDLRLSGGEHEYAGYNDRKYAFVGTPCQVTGLANMEALNLDLARKFRLKVGLFCYENFNYEELVERVEGKTKIREADWAKVNIKGKMLVYAKGKDAPAEIPLKELHDIVRSACNTCLDLTNTDADVSVGGLGAPAGYSTVLIRTKAGADAIDLAIRLGALEGLPDIGDSREAQYAKTLKSVNFVAKRKITTNLKNVG